MNRIPLLDSTLVRHAPVAATFAIAAVFAFALHDITITNVPEFDVGLALAAVATALSVVPALTFMGTLLFTVVPMIDILAIALLRATTGDGASVFTGLVVLPVVWLASSAGGRAMVYALVGSAVVLLAPFALSPGTRPTGADVVRIIVTLTVMTTVALVVNILARATRIEVLDAQHNEVRGIAELDRAAAVQRSLWPEADVTVAEGISVAGRCLPAKTVGGDFFDWYDTGDGIALSIGDVMGKGVGAGLIAAAVRAAVRSAHAIPDPVEALRRASDGLEVASSAADVNFTTLFHARLSSDGELRWADAGHGLAAILRTTGEVDRLFSRDVPLGLSVGEEWQSHTTRLEPGDVLVSVSDGVLDLFGGQPEALKGLTEIARRTYEPASIVAEACALAERVPHDDDVTVVAMRREPLQQSQADAG
jgi:hypothetical protein